ncbi:uncharacterized protein J4E92_010560 [Alternaria infectoria]|uniref:uncharacterized protein n=1 Tax=Alternaria infectoria TaxID=45303 RepID=UPI00221FA415|nr:uncharacterized protein J4E92_010560 [Alternaria infectoria]KAI4909789.1 hypothetical protein J4E92_010560 [Alternaria infectoria]
MPVSLELRTDTEHPDTLTASSECPDIYEETMPSNAPYLLVTINDPETLSVLGNRLATSDADIHILQPQSSRKSADDCFSVPVTAVKVLHIGISPLVSTDDVLNDGDTYGPLMTPFIQSWRDAFRCIPEQHSIERVVFNVRCEDVGTVRKSGHLLQEVSTGMYVKAKRTMGREMVFRVVGWKDVNQKRWLEGALPGKKEGLGAPVAKEEPTIADALQPQ